MLNSSATAPFKLYLLGSFHLEKESKAIHLATRKIESLLAYLVLYPGEHAREKLAALFWGDSLDVQARGSLRTALNTLRRQLGDDLMLTDPEIVQLNPGLPLWVDVKEFARNNFPGLTENDSSTILNLKSQVELYRGDLLADSYDEWVLTERERYRQIYLDALLRLTQSASAAGDPARVIEYAHKLLATDLTNESAHQQLILAYRSMGNRLAALKQYEECKRVLRAELDIDPAPETTALYHEIRQKASEQPAGFVRHTNVPLPLTSFVGRRKEIGEIKEILARERLVTLTGAGGTGKTRLAIRVATDLSGTEEPRPFPDGIWWIELAVLHDPALIPQSLANVLGVRPAPDQPISELLVHHLDSKQTLLVFDNCEHLVNACAQLAENLLRACPNLKIMATSLQPLGILGESAYLVPTLSRPATLHLPIHQVLEHEATRLFVERALAARFGFALNEQNAIAIGQICQRLDGIPLAIELAAARVKVLSPEEIASRLDDRFEILTLGSRTALPRHQTLRATIDWSYNLLTETERILFRRLSVFPDGFTFESAKAVCTGAGITQPQVLDLIAYLVDKSLIMIAAPRPGIEQTRYHLLESIREYAFGKLEETGEAEPVRDRHLEYFVELAERAESNTFGAQSLRYVQRLDQELENIRDAMDWAIRTHQATTAFRLAAALNYFWAGGPSYIGYNRSSMGEWQGILNKALALPEGLKRTAGRAKALNAIGFFLWTDISPVDPRHELEQALSISRELADHSLIARSLCNLGLLESAQGNYAQARSLLEQGLALLRELVPERKTDYLWALIFLGDVALYRDAPQEAQTFYGECSGALREMHDRNFQAYVVRRLGILAGHRGEFENATRLCEESLNFNLELGHERAVTACLSAFAGIALARGQAEQAAKLFGTVSALLDARSSRLPRTDHMEYDRNVSRLGLEMDPATLEKTWAAGEELTLYAAIKLALEY